MLNAIRMWRAKFSDFVESRRARSYGWLAILREIVYVRRTAIIVEKDLSEITERLEPLTKCALEMVEITPGMLSSETYRFAVPSRVLKAWTHLQRGHGGFAIVRNQMVVGDAWYYGPEAMEKPAVIESLRRLGFDTWSKSDVFTLDIYVAPSERKGGVSAAFQNNAMLALRSKGYSKAFGVYYADDLAAYWCTRVTNRWKELRAATVTRFLLLMTFTKEIPLRRVAHGAVKSAEHETRSA